MRCKLRLSTKKSDGHSSQIVTGFMLLKAQGKIDLEIEMTPDHPYAGIVEVTVDDRYKLAYDVCDGYVFDIDHVLKYANKCDLYFKRSFDSGLNAKYGLSDKIYPLGFNYHVTVKGNILDKTIAPSSLGKLKSNIKELVGLSEQINFSVEKFEQDPLFPSTETKVLFMARTWSNEGAHDQEETHYLDTTRAAIIRSLRKELGNFFIGGFSRRDYALKHFSDCVLDESMTDRRKYMRIVKQSDICIATTGLWGSIGWKFGEYVAASKAIVSERLRYKVTGNFEADKHYIEFLTVDECVEKTVKLSQDKDRIYQIKMSNHVYYHNFLRPDVLIMNTLNQVKSHSHENSILIS